MPKWNAPLLNIALVIGIGVLSTVILSSTASVLQPFAISVFFVYLVFPLVRILSRHRCPKLVAYIIATTTFFIALYVLGYMMALNLQTFVEQIPMYAVKINAAFAYLEQISERWGVLDSGETLTFRDLVMALPEGALANWIGDSTTSFMNFAGNLVLIAFFMLFILLEVERLPERIQLAYGLTRARVVTDLIQDINKSVEQYIILKVVVSLVTAVLSIIVMASFGLNLFFLWGVLVFVLNFIPYFGSIVATVLPTLMALLQFDSGWSALGLGALLTLLQNGIGNVLEPAWQGRNLNLSPLLILVALTFWGWLWGVVGMLLAVPIMVSIRIVFEHFPTLRPYAILMSNASGLDNAEHKRIEELQQKDQRRRFTRE
ncbi:MAG: AI-2E family transporter [Myxococcales bacterium]|nr:AI-2E family transporter [Myxococcales bacterium]